MYHTRPKNAQTSIKFVGTGQSEILMDSAQFLELRYDAQENPSQSHFFGLQNKCAVISAFMTMSMCFTCSAIVLDQITMSSI